MTIRGIDFYHLLSFLIIYSFLGWLWETCYVSAKQGKLINRGFITGPLCTIYGCGAMAVYLILNPVSENLAFLYFGGVAVATALEYVTAVLMESIFHTSWWDYSDNRFNFQGRICLGASVGWGVFTVGFFRILHPVVADFVELYSRKTGEIAICIIGILYVADFSVSAATAFHLHDRIPAWEQALDQMQMELTVKAREKLKTVADARGVSVDFVKEHLENRLGERELALFKELEEKRLVLMEEGKKELQKYKEALAGKLSFTARRFVRSYPNLNRGYRIRKQKKFKIKQETKDE